jgi:hypothetical protein
MLLEKESKTKLMIYMLQNTDRVKRLPTVVLPKAGLELIGSAT